MSVVRDYSLHTPIDRLKLQALIKRRVRDSNPQRLSARLFSGQRLHPARYSTKKWTEQELNRHFSKYSSSVILLLFSK